MPTTPRPSYGSPTAAPQHHDNSSCHRVSSVNPQICPSDIATSIAEQVSDCAHQVFGPAHFTNWDQRSPFVIELWIIIQYLPGPVHSYQRHPPTEQAQGKEKLTVL